MAYDPGTGQLILFGGSNTGGNAERHLDLGRHHLDPAEPRRPARPARPDASMAYDPATGQLVLFGGMDAASDCSVTPGPGTAPPGPSRPRDHPPRPGRHASMAYDAATGQLVLFGGVNGNTGMIWPTPGPGTARNWTQQSPRPPARPPATTASMAFDAGTGQLVLCGGNRSGAILNDTWTWDGTTWTQQSPIPQARYVASMAYDAATGQLVLFGGSTSNTSFDYAQDTWVWGIPGLAAAGDNFTSSPPSPANYGGSYTPAATGGASGNPVLFSVNASSAGVCSINGPTVSFIGAGNCVIHANQVGDNDYVAAPTVEQSFMVQPAALTITADNQTKAYGGGVPA